MFLPILLCGQIPFLYDEKMTGKVANRNKKLYNKSKNVKKSLSLLTKSFCSAKIRLKRNEQEGSQMNEHQIMLNATEDVKEFVNAASKCDFDIDIFYNRIIIDAKSLLGILSMDLTRQLTVRCYGENPHFTKVIKKFAVA